MIDFLGIGAQKSGTTWLMKNLVSHPGVWTPKRLKELHYFDVLYLDHHRKSRLNRIRRRVEKAKGNILGRVRLSNDKLEYFERISDPDFAFTDQWYEHIFSPAADRVKGEFTPSYCAIGDEGVAHVKRLMPDVKLIYMIRDPRERALSSLRMLLERPRVRQRTPAELAAEPLFLKKGDYAHNIPAWEAAFDPSQILYIPFGRVKHDPHGVLAEVETYLGLEPYADYPMVGKKVNATGKKKVEISGDVVAQIEAAVEPQYDYLAKRFGEGFLESIR